MPNTPAPPPSPETVKLNFDFNKHLTTLNLASIAFTLVMFEQGIIAAERQPWVLHVAFLAFGVSLLIGLCEMVFFASAAHSISVVPKVIASGAFVFALGSVMWAGGVFNPVPKAQSPATVTAPAAPALPSRAR